MPKEKRIGMRLDKALVERGIVSSRTRAQTLLAGGGIAIAGVIETDGSRTVTARDKIELHGADIRWVSRAGLKLEHALTHWKIAVKGKVALDIGASTGGFTDVLLARGAKKVYALDVGHGQLAKKLVADPRVISMEGVHIKDVDKSDFKEKIGIVVVDVSFISLEKVLPKAKEVIAKDGILIALVKPQFEVGKGRTKKGIVTDPLLHAEVARKAEALAEGLGFSVAGVIASPVIGGEGNKEFLLYGTLSGSAS